jgi:ATP-binding cassette subfamily B protein
VSEKPPIDRGRLFGNILTGIRMCWAAAPLGFAAILAMVAVDAAIPAVVLLLSRQLVNRVVAGAGLTTALLAVIVGLGLASGLERAMGAVRRHWQDIFSQRVQQAATVRFLSQAGTIDLGHLDQPEFQDHMERASNGWRSNDLTQTGIGLAGNLLSLAGMLGVLLSIQPLLVVLGLLSVVPTFALQRRANRKIFDFWYSWTPLERERDYIRWLLSRPHSAKEMRAFQLTGHLLTRYRDLAQQNLAILARLYRAANRGAVVGAVLGGVALAGAYLVMAQPGSRHLSPGDLTAGIGAIASIAAEVSLIFSSILVLDQNARYLNSYFEFVATPPLVLMPDRPRPVPDLRTSRIEFRDVSFRYPKSARPVLERVNLTIEPGELVALVGANGSGKTTLVQLLLRLYDPESGQVCIGGVDLRDMNPTELRSHIGVLFQEYGRYELRLRDSVHFGRIEKQPHDEELLACLRASQADEVVRDLPRGLDSNIGRLFEGGHDLSTGQWQRVALARLVFRSAELWVLDEPTASLDPEAEAAIFAELRRHLRGRTGIVISHRFSTVRTADKIAVIERGRLRELGSHDELVAAGGWYAELFELQAAGYR